MCHIYVSVILVIFFKIILKSLIRDFNFQNFETKVDILFILHPNRKHLRSESEKNDTNKEINQNSLQRPFSIYKI